MSASEVDTFFGSLFSSSSNSSTPSVPDVSLPSVDTSLSVSTGNEKSMIDTLLDLFRKKGLYILGAIVVLCLLIWLLRRYQTRQLPEHFEVPPPEDEEILTEDMIIDSEKAGPTLPSFPEPVYQPSPLMDPAPSSNALVQLEQQLTQHYADFEQAAKSPQPDLRALQTWVSTMASLLAKMKEIILPVLQSEQSPAELKQQLQKGLQDAQMIVTMAQNKVEEIRRIQTSTENEQETKSVVKNMHYLGLGNKIKHSKAKLPSV